MDGRYIRMAVGQESTENEPGGLQSFKPEGEGETDESEGRVSLINPQCMAVKRPRQHFNNCI